MEEIKKILSRFQKQKVLVIGDAILDGYLNGDSSRLCREAPVPIVDVLNTENAPGASANTAMNVRSLGAEVDFLTVIGDDYEGNKIIELFKEKGINTSMVLKDKTRKTQAKYRVMCANQLIVRYDYGTSSPVSNEMESKIISLLEQNFHKYNAVIIADYEKGVITPGVIKAVAQLRTTEYPIVAVDAKHLENYRATHPTTVKPNYREAIRLLKVKNHYGSKRIEQITDCAKKLQEITGAEIPIVTLDADGAVVFKNGACIYKAKAHPVKNPYVSGAGDTFISAFTIALSSKSEISQAAEIATTASAIAVSKDGTSTCSNYELMEFYSSSTKKIEDMEIFVKRCDIYKHQNKKIIFTNGYFDILQPAHIEFLRKAKEYGDILIVGINTDNSAKEKLGRSLANSLEERIKVLSAVQEVDYIISFDEESPLNLIKQLHPDVYIKGGTYTEASIPEREEIEEYGGKIVIAPYIEQLHQFKRVQGDEQVISYY